MMLRFLTAESPMDRAYWDHRGCRRFILVEDDINRSCPQTAGYGRGGRMQIEQDRVRLCQGFAGETLHSHRPRSGQPGLANWQEIMSAAVPASPESAAVTRPRQGMPTFPAC